MNTRQAHNTAFYIETLLMIVAFVAVILVLTRTFGEARRESARAKELTDAVILAQNAAEAVSASENLEDLARLLDETIAAPYLGRPSIEVRDGKLFAASEDGYITEVSWEPRMEASGTLVSSTITVRLAGSADPIYALDTAVYLREVQP